MLAAHNQTQSLKATYMSDSNQSRSLLCCLWGACVSLSLSPHRSEPGQAMPGWQQKLAKHRHGEAASSSMDTAKQVKPGDLAESPFAELLIKRWADGAMSAKDCVRLSKAAVLSKIDDPEVQWLGSLSAEGGGNASRAIYRRYLGSMEEYLPDATMVSTPIKIPGGADMHWQDISMILPHMWLHSMSKHPQCDEVLGAEFMGFWSKCNHGRKWLHHPVNGSDLNSMVPFCLHGDGGAFQERDSLSVTSLKPLHGDRGDHLLISAIPYSICNSSTMTHVWSVIAWPLRAMLEGKHPKLDWNGEAWPEKSKEAGLAGQQLCTQKFRGVVWGLTGDMEWYAKEFKLPCYPNADSFCWLCKANRDTHIWTDWNLHSEWRQSVAQFAFTCVLQMLLVVCVT